MSKIIPIRDNLNYMENLNKSIDKNKASMSSLRDIEALILYRDYTMYELQTFLAEEERKDKMEAEDDSDKLSNHQKEIINRAIEYHAVTNNIRLSVTPTNKSEFKTLPKRS